MRTGPWPRSSKPSRMPELNPRRVASTKGRFAQVSAAVLAGMAAMFCLQNMIEFRREATRPAAPVPAPEVEPVPEIALILPQGVKRQMSPVPSSMLLKSEPGLSSAEVSVVGVSGEEAPPKYEAPPPPSTPKAKKKEMPRLQERNIESKFASSAVRNDGRFARIKHRAPVEEAPQAVAPAPPPKPVVGASVVALIKRGSSEPENLKPAPIAQISVPEAVFWTPERKIQFGAAFLVMVFGIIYLIYASGVRDAPPERAEGER
ncbi:MAG: hypothetical protein COV48_12980 [Elusimicrobia bacterium CG11_big_fil_rev_8_21_14_0_20_64_6]|nr:MAG: hypothetical protein COV48_12980 [Elusimicrobia bacterium CG11_big_fil_rev_8_21_14_0_20_64_6]